MPSDIAVPTSTFDPGQPARAPEATSAQPLLGYVLSVVLVGAAAVVAFLVDQLVPASNLSLVFVVPVIVAALSFGWGPALMSAVLSVGIVDFFFVEPRLTFAVARPSDIWALALLLVVAAIVSTVAAQSRGRALAARRSAGQAEALHALAHAVIRSEPSPVLIKAAADTLGRIFNGPSVVLAEQSGKLVAAASSGGAVLSATDMEAAAWSLANAKATRAETYPFDQAEFDFWPVETPASPRLVLGVKFAGRSEGRAAADRHAELVAAYLAAAGAGRGGKGRT